MCIQKPLPAIDHAATLIDVLRTRADDTPDRVAYTFLGAGGIEEAFLTFELLDRRARSLAARLQSLAPSGSRVLLLCSSGPDVIVGFLGCLYASAIAVPCAPPHKRAMERLTGIIEDAQPAVALAPAKDLQSLSRRLADATDASSLQWLAVDECDGRQAEQWRPGQPTGDDVAFLQYTSGSTAAPKGVKVTHRSLMSNLDAIRQAFGAAPQTVSVSWLPPHHDMGLIGGILTPLHVGAQAVLMTPSAFLRNPIAWLRAVSRYRAHVSGGPNFAYDLCARRAAKARLTGLDLSQWEVAFTGAEPIRHETLDKFVAAFEPYGFRREAFYPCYGLAEATLFVTGGDRREAPQALPFARTALEKRQVLEAGESGGDQQTLLSCGRPAAGHDVTIAAPKSGAACPAGQVGEICVRGPSVADGYWSRPEESRQRFHATVAGEGPFLRTGDLGFLHEGNLFIAGRIKDLIILRGRNLHPQDIEATAEKTRATERPSCAAAFSIDMDQEERLVVVQEADRRLGNDEAEEIAAAIRQAVAEEHEAHVHAVVLIRKGTLPRTTSGKIQRRACRENYIRGGFSVVYSSVCSEKASESPKLVRRATVRHTSAVCGDIQTRLAEMVGAAPETIDPDRSLNVQGIDSLMAVEMQLYLKERFDFLLSIQDFTEDITINGLARRIAASTANRQMAIEGAHAS